MYLIFDFDGTLVDSFQSIIEKFNFLAAEYNFRKINCIEAENIRHLTSQEFIDYLQIPMHKIPEILRKVRKNLSSEIPKLPTFENLPMIIQELHKKQHYLGIVTSNAKQNVTKWLCCNGLQTIFNFIEVESNYFGKTDILKKL